MTEEMLAPSRHAMRRRRRLLVGVALAATGVTIAGLGASALIKSPADVAAQTAAPPRSELTAVVEKRVLKDTVVLRGDVTAAQTVQVSPQPGGSGEGETGTSQPVVTRLFVKAGDKVGAGKVLAEVAGRPVFALPGKLPVYRDLRPGSDGADVGQLQQALRERGQAIPNDDDGHFGPDTKRAVERFYRSIGYDVPLAGGRDNTALDSAEQAVVQAQRQYDGLRAGNCGGGGTSPNPTTSPAPGGSACGQQVRYAREDLQRAKQKLAKVRAESGAMVPASEMVFLSGFPARIDKLNATVGGNVEDDMMTVSAGQLLVSVRLRPFEKDLVRVGLPATIDSDLSLPATQAKVTTVADSPTTEQNEQGQGQGESFFPASITPAKPLDPRLAGQSVRITVAAATTTGEVLTVPSSAVYSEADGAAVVLRRRPGHAPERIKVKAGISGDGYVEIRPVDGKLAAGDTVLIR